ncbi:MAG: AAA family ATPase [Candidatus Andersenbacteria bacterium]
MKLDSTSLHVDTRSRYRSYVLNVTLRAPLVVILGILFTLGGLGFFMFGITSPTLLGVGYILWGLASGVWLVYVYGNTSLLHEDPPHTVSEILQPDTNIVNIGDVLSWDAIEVIGGGTDKDLPLETVVAQLLRYPPVQSILQFIDVPAEQLFEALRQHLLPQLTLSQWIYTAASQAAARGQQSVFAADLLGALMLDPAMRSSLRQFDLQEQDVSFIVWWNNLLRIERENKKRWWDREALVNFTGVGFSWAAGFTPFIDSFAHIPSGNIWDQPYGHFDQVDQLITSLARTRQSNVLLVGQPGVGRLGVIKELSRRVDAQIAHPALNGSRVVYIHIGQLLSLGASGPQQMQLISKALAEMQRAGNIIAVLDGVGSILGVTGEERINLTDVLLPFFSSSGLRVVVIMATQEYHERLKANDDLMHLFEMVQVPPLDEQSTLQLLALTKSAWEQRANVNIPYKVLREIVEATADILPYVPFPEKAFDILEEIIVNAQAQQKRQLSADDVNELITRKTGIRMGKIKGLEGERLLHLEDFIHQRVVNQVQGVAAVSRAMVRARAGVGSREKPIGTFLFLGPTGVGKTETAKALAEAFFGSGENLQRLDMTEFQGEGGVVRLLGGAEHKTGRLTSMVADHPYAVLLLDEFEKADRLVKQLFLPVFDEGYITDAYGRKYSFRNTIIVATSNAGAELIRTSVDEQGKVPADFEKTLRDHILSEGLFRPEELNRFDGVVTFTPLTQEHIRQVASLMLKKLNKRLDSQHGITVNVTDELINFLVKVGYNPEFGARPMARAIQDTVEYAVARQVASGGTQPGVAVTINPAQFERAS